MSSSNPTPIETLATPRAHREAEEVKGRALPHAFRALGYRNFQLFFCGQLISLIGTWMQTVAQSWLVYRMTGRGVLLGAVTFASQIPVFLIAPIGGVVADRFSRHRIVIATQTFMMLLAFILAALTLSGTVKVWHLLVLSSLLGCANAFDIPARQSFIVEMVGKLDLMNAIALNSSMFNGARIIGPAIAGILVGAIGEGWCFFLNGVSYIAVIVGLLLMHIEAPFRSSKRGTTPLQEILEGFRFVAQTPPIRALLLLLALVSFAGLPYTVLMPIFADQILHGGPRALGQLMGATGLGALCGALLLAARRELKGLTLWIGLSTVSFGASLMLFSTSRNFWLSVVLLVPVGLAMMVQMAASNTLIQAMVPDALRGRVMSVYSMMFMGMGPIGALLAGALSDRVGASVTVMIGGCACIAGTLPFFLRMTVLHQHAHELIRTQQAAAAEED